MRLVLAFLVASALAAAASAEPAPAPSGGPLRVGVFDHPPFAAKAADGTWTGLGIDLWQHITDRLGIEYSFVETDSERALADVAGGRFDVLVAGTAVSATREQIVSFTQPFLASPAAVALKRNTSFPHWIDFTRDVLSHGVLSILWLLVGTMIAFSLVLWFVERRVNVTHFGGHPVRGLGSALWFAAVTLTTVGYGDKTPRTVAGRVIVFFWMFFGVFIVGIFTATLASSIAVARLQTSITRPSDLSRFRNGVLDGSLAQGILNGAGVPARVFPTIEAGLHALDENEITAFLDTEASLRYIINQQYPGEMVIDSVPSTHVSIAFATRIGLPQLDAINVALIEETTSRDWPQEITRWIGPPAE